MIAWAAMRVDLKGVARDGWPMACAAAFALAINLLPIQLPLGIAFFLGGSIAIAMLLAGFSRSFAAGLAGALAGFTLTDQPSLLVLPLIGEAVALRVAVASRRSVQATAFFYWILIGAPAAGMLLALTSAKTDAVLLLATALAVNGILNATLGGTLAWLVRNRGGKLSITGARHIRDVIASAIMPAIILPAFLLLLFYVHAVASRAARSLEAEVVTQALLLASGVADAVDKMTLEEPLAVVPVQRDIASLLQLVPGSTALTLRAGTTIPSLSVCKAAACSEIDPIPPASGKAFPQSRLPPDWTGQVRLNTFGGATQPRLASWAESPLQVDLQISAVLPKQISVRFSAQEQVHQLARLMTGGFAVFIGIYGMILIASRTVAVLVSKPLERISTAFGRFSQEGDGPELQDTGISELDRLSQELAASRHRLQRVLADHREVTRGLERLGQELPFMFLIWSDFRKPGEHSVLAYSSSPPDQRFDVPLELFSDVSLWLLHVHPDDQSMLRIRLQEAPTTCRFEATYRVKQRSGRWIWISTACLLFPGAGGRTAAVGYWLDVTAQRTSNDRIHQTSKLRLLGEMATGMAHELNQPLNSIRLAAENMHYQLDTSVPEGAKGNMFRKIDRIIQQAVRASQMIERMRVFGRPSSQNMRWVHPSVLIEAAIDATRATFDQAGLSIRSVAESGVPGILVDRVQIEQALANVLTNACDATIRRSERDRNFDRSEAEVVVRLRHEPETAGVLIEVEDQAGGIEPSLRERIIEPFFTTKLPGDGPGLGLTLAYGVVREHGGDLDLTDGSEGTIFILKLPTSN